MSRPRPAPAMPEVTTADLLAGPRRWDSRTRTILDKLACGAGSDQIAWQMRMHHDVVLQILFRCRTAYRLESLPKLAEWWLALLEDRESGGEPHLVTDEDRMLLGAEAHRVMFSRWRME